MQPLLTGGESRAVEKYVLRSLLCAAFFIPEIFYFVSWSHKIKLNTIKNPYENAHNGIKSIPVIGKPKNPKGTDDLQNHPQVLWAALITIHLLISAGLQTTIPCLLLSPD